MSESEPTKVIEGDSKFVARQEIPEEQVLQVGPKQEQSSLKGSEVADSPPFAADEVRISSVRAELTNLLAVQQAERRRTVLFMIGCPLGFFGCATVIAWLGSDRISANVFHIMFIGAFFLSLICSGPGFLGVWISNDECANTAWKLRSLDEEAIQTTRAFELARSGSGFVLFLRSFGEELKGLDYFGKNLGNISRGMAMNRAARSFEFYVPDVDHLIAYRKWTAELDVLRSIQQRYPVILLGNTALSSNMHQELAQTGIIIVTIQAQDWWQIFLYLVRHAYLIVFYIETASPTLLREMQHIGTQSLRYAIFADEAQLRCLAEEPTLGESFLSSAVLRVNLGDIAHFWELMEFARPNGV